jgi:hypothetical protein
MGVQFYSAYGQGRQRYSSAPPPSKVASGHIGAAHNGDDDVDVNVLRHKALSLLIVKPALAVQPVDYEPYKRCADEH